MIIHKYKQSSGDFDCYKNREWILKGTLHNKISTQLTIKPKPKDNENQSIILCILSSAHAFGRV